jgi:hypothetical protein
MIHMGKTRVTGGGADETRTRDLRRDRPAVLRPPISLASNFRTFYKRIGLRPIYGGQVRGLKQAGNAARFVRFCYYAPQLLLLFLGRVLLQDTGELQQPHLTGNVYR